MIFKSNNTNLFLLNIAFFLIPVSFIIGNSFINFNIFIILFISLLLFKLEIFKINLSKIDLLVLIFFTYIIINGILNNFFNFEFSDVPDQNIIIKKSFLYLRFLLLYFVIRFLIFKNFINYKYLFLSFGFCSLFVSIDLIIQFIFGTDIFGFDLTDNRLSGPFGDEKIAGSFIQRFFIFIPYSILLFSKFSNKLFLNIALFLSFFFITLGTVLSGNRMPLVLLIISFFILFIFEKNFRRNLLILFFLSSAGLIYLITKHKHNLLHYELFVQKSSVIVKYFKNRIIAGKIVEVNEKCKNIDLQDDQNTMKECRNYLNVYIKEIESGILTWEENKYFGGGIKSFRWNCNKIDRSKMLYFVSKKGKVNCNNHPHNYYLQVAAELGLLGFIIVILIFTSILVKGFKYFKNFNKNNHEMKIFVPFFIIFVLEIFPFKTTGSFFTTTNATFLFIILSFTVGLMNKKEKT